MPKQMNPHANPFTPSWKVIDNELNPNAHPFIPNELVIRREAGYINIITKIKKYHKNRLLIDPINLLQPYETIPLIDPPPYEP